MWPNAFCTHKKKKSKHRSNRSKHPKKALIQESFHYEFLHYRKMLNQQAHYSGEAMQIRFEKRNVGSVPYVTLYLPIPPKIIRVRARSIQIHYPIKTHCKHKQAWVTMQDMHECMPAYKTGKIIQRKTKGSTEVEHGRNLNWE